ncbi:MAG: hypothetical protein ACE5FJ_01700, partial [Gemmatimonadales bacterium]
MVVGFAPLLCMLAFVPGFAASFYDSLLDLLARGTNLPRAVPWPWLVDYAPLEFSRQLARFSVGSLFLLMAVGYPLGLLLTATSRTPDKIRRRSVLIAATVTGAVYAHHAAVRSDVWHLAQCIPPFLLAWFALPAALGYRKRPLATLATYAILVLLTGLAVPPYHPWLSLGVAHSASRGVPFDVAGDPLRLRPFDAALLANLQTMVRHHVPDDATLLITPARPGL